MDIKENHPKPAVAPDFKWKIICILVHDINLSQFIVHLKAYRAIIDYPHWKSFEHRPEPG